MFCVSCKAALKTSDSSKKIYICFKNHYICDECKEGKTTNSEESKFVETEFCDKGSNKEIEQNVQEIGGPTNEDPKTTDEDETYLKDDLEKDELEEVKLPASNIPCSEELLCNKQESSDLIALNGTFCEGTSKESEVLAHLDEDASASNIIKRKPLYGATQNLGKTNEDVLPKCYDSIFEQAKASFTAQMSETGAFLAQHLDHFTPKKITKRTKPKSLPQNKEEHDNKRCVEHTLDLDDENSTKTNCLSIPPWPLRCALCGQIMFPSDFVLHVRQDHEIREYIKPGISVTFNINVSKLLKRNQKSICLKTYLFLCEQKIVGHRHSHNMLPVHVQCCQLLTKEVVKLSNGERVCKTEANNFMLWVTMLLPHNLALKFDLAAWNNSSNKPYIYQRICDKVLPISDSQDLAELYQSSSTLKFKMSQIEVLKATDGTLTLELKIESS